MSTSDDGWSSQVKPLPSKKQGSNDLVEKLVLKLATEQTRARRWSIFFKILLFIYLFAIFGLASTKTDMTGGVDGNADHTGMIEVSGMIGEGNGMGVSADQLVGSLRAAFEAKNAKAILLRINSPGGTPVNASMVYDEILRLRKKYPEKKVMSAIVDMGTSGAYYIAAATESIYANEASVVGSIGVISAGYGFVDVMEKVGVERRVFTAGNNKAMLDPFSEIKPEQKQHFESILKDVHEKFVTDVTAGRGDRIKDEQEIFSGLFWSGVKAKELGLIDGFASPGQVARDILKYETIIDYTARPQGFSKFLEILSAPLVSVMGQFQSKPPVMATPM